MTQLRIPQLPAETFKREPQYVTAQEYREFHIPHPTPTPKERT